MTQRQPKAQNVAYRVVPPDRNIETFTNAVVENEVRKFTGLVVERDFMFILSSLLCFEF